MTILSQFRKSIKPSRATASSAMPLTQYLIQYPHCDPRVLHAPGECEYCDSHPDWQELRNTWAINFTGHRLTDRVVCPAEAVRSLHDINAWGGNVPSRHLPTVQQIDTTIDELKELRRNLKENGVE